MRVEKGVIKQFHGFKAWEVIFFYSILNEN